MTDDLARYRVVLIGDDARCREVSDEIDHRVHALGLADWATVEYGDVPDPAMPSVVAVCWPPGDIPAAMATVGRAQELGVLVVPVVDTIDGIPADLPDALGVLNAIGWDYHGAAGVAGICLRELGITERERRLFISYRRSDGTLTAAQLHDALCGTGWNPFIDRLGIEGGQVVQAEIDAALEDMAFLLLLETPEAAQSRWIDHEVLYAKSNHMGLLIVNINDAPHVPMADDLPRIGVVPDEVDHDGSQLCMADDAVDRILAATERAHTAAMARRRRALVLSTKASAERAGAAVSHRPEWRLRVDHRGTAQLVSHLPRVPDVADLHGLHSALVHDESGLLIHAAHRLPEDRETLLQWAVENRPLELLPANAIGARWVAAT